MREKHRHFLMVGRRWDIEVTASFSPGDKDWERHLRRRVLQNGRRRGPEWIDYFVFSRGLYREDMPPFVVGRVFWDNWLVWKALASHFSIADASNAVLAVHQNHDYRYHPLGRQGAFCGAESERNYELAGGWKHLRTIVDATEVLRRGGLRPSRVRYWASAKRYVRQAWRVFLHGGIERAWFFFLGLTRRLRRKIGLNTESLRRVLNRAGSAPGKHL